MCVTCSIICRCGHPFGDHAYPNSEGNVIRDEKKYLFCYLCDCKKATEKNNLLLNCD